MKYKAEDGSVWEELKGRADSVPVDFARVIIRLPPKPPKPPTLRVGDVIGVLILSRVELEHLTVVSDVFAVNANAQWFRLKTFHDAEIIKTVYRDGKCIYDHLRDKA